MFPLWWAVDAIRLLLLSLQEHSEALSSGGTQSPLKPTAAANLMEDNLRQHHQNERVACYLARQMMDFQEFRAVSKRTMRFGDEHRANAALGLVGELGEYLTPGENKYEEAGDALFYHGWLCEFYNITPTIKRDFYQQDDLLMSAAAIADMVKKEVFHGKPVDREVLAEHLSDIWSFFVNNYGGFTLSDIYKANIAKLRTRHPLDKGYTNEGQNARADVQPEETSPILQANPCSCCESRRAMTYEVMPDGHELECKQCGRSVIGVTIEEMLYLWNNPTTRTGYRLI